MDIQEFIRKIEHIGVERISKKARIQVGNIVGFGQALERQGVSSVKIAPEQVLASQFMGISIVSNPRIPENIYAVTLGGELIAIGKYEPDATPTAGPKT